MAITLCRHAHGVAQGTAHRSPLWSPTPWQTPGIDRGSAADKTSATVSVRQRQEEASHQCRRAGRAIKTSMQTCTGKGPC
jgi:hypothetical protein